MDEYNEMSPEMQEWVIDRIKAMTKMLREAKENNGRQTA